MSAGVGLHPHAVERAAAYLFPELPGRVAAQLYRAADRAARVAQEAADPTAYAVLAHLRAAIGTMERGMLTPYELVDRAR